MRYVRILFLLFLTCLLAGCSDEEIDDPNALPERGIVLKLTTGQLDTKAHLYSQAGLHHVQQIYALLYYCGDGTTDAIDPDQTTVVTSQRLDWDPTTDTGYGAGQAQSKTFELRLPDEQISLVPGKYMILCVGLDEASGDTYGLSYSDTSAPSFAQKGAKLSAANAVLAKAAAAETSPYTGDATGTTNKQDKDLIAYGQPDMAHAELFAGWQAFDFMPDDLNVVEVELRRRVAGVLCYLSDIPYKLNLGTTPYRVTKVRLNLFDKQNTQIGLKRDNESNPSETDFGTEAKASQTICEFDLMPFTPQTNATGDGDLLYKIPTAHLEGRKQLENTILMGAYVLPIKNEGSTPTLQVELLGYEYDDGTDDDIAAGKGPEDQAALTTITSFPAIYEGNADPNIYSLHPNMIYHIGQKLDNDNTEGDYPESLLGTKIKIEAKPWVEQDIHVEFPSVPIVPMMSLMDGAGATYQTEPENAGDAYYIFDCIGSETYHLEISSSVLYANWKLVATTTDGSTPWIQFLDETTGSYVSELEGKGAAHVNMRMDDYASLSDWQQDVATREILLTLIAEDENGKEVLDAQSSLAVTQYNALIVAMNDADKGYRGFSRFDYGTKRNPITGAITEEGTKIQWGYFSSGIVVETNSDGKRNYMGLPDDAAFEGGFMGSAMQVCALGEYGGTLNIDKDSFEEPFWYLPARFELETFFKTYANSPDKASIKRDEYYWSANGFGGSIVYRAYAFKIGVGKFDWDGARKGNYYYARQACYVQ